MIKIPINTVAESVLAYWCLFNCRISGFLPRDITLKNFSKAVFKKYTLAASVITIFLLFSCAKCRAVGDCGYADKIAVEQVNNLSSRSARRITCINLQIEQENYNSKCEFKWE